MNDQKSKLYAVLTGDLVKSQKLSIEDLESARRHLLSAVDKVSDWKPGLVRGKAEFFRGDAWQLLLADPGQALRVAVYLRASVRAQGLSQTRISIGLGTVDLVDEERVSLSIGEAFVLSGHGLDKLKKQRLAIEVPHSVGVLTNWIRVVAHLCDAIVSQWTARQSEITTFALEPVERTHSEIAEELNIKQQTVTNSLRGARWNAVQEGIELFDQTDWEAVFRGDPANQSFC